MAMVFEDQSDGQSASRLSDPSSLVVTVMQGRNGQWKVEAAFRLR